MNKKKTKGPKVIWKVMLNKIRLIRFGCHSAAVFVLDVSPVGNWTPTRFGARQMCKPVIVDMLNIMQSSWCRAVTVSQRFTLASYFLKTPFNTLLQNTTPKNNNRYRCEPCFNMAKGQTVFPVSQYPAGSPSLHYHCFFTSSLSTMSLQQCNGSTVGIFF